MPLQTTVLLIKSLISRPPLYRRLRSAVTQHMGDTVGLIDWTNRRITTKRYAPRVEGCGNNLRREESRGEPQGRPVSRSTTASPISSHV